MNRVSSNKHGRGFTIIEVSMVLAIAGLIFLMVFIALPALQRQARDTTRKEDIDLLSTKLKQYQTNHRGAIPSKQDWDIWTSIRYDDDTNPRTAPEWDKFYEDYLGKNFVDPNGTQYYLVVGSCGTGATGQNCSIPASINYTSTGPGSINSPATATFPNGHSIFVVAGAKCSGENTIRTSDIRKVALLYKLESGGVYCKNT